MKTEEGIEVETGLKVLWLEHGRLPELMEGTVLPTGASLLENGAANVVPEGMLTARGRGPLYSTRTEALRTLRRALEDLVARATARLREAEAEES